jgi:diacylglycerol kinase (ATP)
MLYNPRAGSIVRRGPAFAERIVKMLEAEGHHVTAEPTRGPGHAAQMAATAAATGADLVIVAGGDGTINEALGGLVYSPVPLAVLPAGTANVLANEIGLARMEDAVRALRGCAPVRVSAGKLTNNRGVRHFLLLAGAGFDAQVVYEVNLGLKARLGKLAYYAATWSRIGHRLPQFSVHVDGQDVRASFVLTSRVRNYGGDLEICRGAHLLDDDFEVVILEGRYVIRYLHYFAGIITGRLNAIPGARVLRTNRVELDAPSDSRIYVQVDGEKAGQLPATIEIVPEAVSLLLPDPYCERWRTSRRERVGA